MTILLILFTICYACLLLVRLKNINRLIKEIEELKKEIEDTIEENGIH